MAFDTFKALVDKVPFVGTIELYKSGEPFLNPDLFAMIGYARDRNIRVIVSTHFSFAKPDEFFEGIVASGLDRLVISLDGASRESYSQYRIGGNFDLVMANIKKLLETRNRLQKNTPEIVWQFLVNRFNEHEIASAQQIARELNIKLDIRPLDLDDELPDVVPAESIEARMSHWLPSDGKYIHDRYRGKLHYPLFPGACKDLFTRLVVTADGKIFPCCMVWDKDSVFGDLLTDAFDDIWYSRKYLDARARFLQKDFSPQAPSVCFRCNNFGAAPSLRDKLALLLAVYRKYVGHRIKRFL